MSREAMAIPGLLHGARVYLSGPMYFGGSQHSGTDEGWRYRVTHVLEDHGATVFNPWRSRPSAASATTGVRVSRISRTANASDTTTPRKAPPGVPIAHANRVRCWTSTCA